MESRRDLPEPNARPPRRGRRAGNQDANTPPPEVIYRRRRVAGVVILLVVVGLVVWIMSLFGGNNNNPDPAAASATSTASTTATTTSTSTSTETSTSTTTSLAEPTTTVTSVLPQKDSCELQDLVITATSDKATYNPGEQPKFYMSIENPTKSDCVINLDDNLLRFEVYDLATNRRVWSDVDCNASEGAGQQTYQPGKKVFFEAIWSRTESAPEQCKNRPEAPAGGYYLHALIGNNHSDAHTFNLAPQLGL